MLRKIIIVLTVLLPVTFQCLKGQDVEFPELEIEQDSIVLAADTFFQEKKEMTKPSEKLKEPSDNGSTFAPDPMKAVWYSSLMPGLGQIYNRRYWKLPIVIGGYLGLTYATSWNARYYKDYSVAYRDAMDDDPKTNSYLNFLPVGTVDATLDKSWLQNALKSKKDMYRRNRDLCIISMVGLYLVCMVDAYVDAQLFQFDISPDLSLRVMPAIIEPSGFRSASYGLQCAITF